MKALILALCLPLAALAQTPIKLATLTTVGGVTYQNVTITQKLPDGVKIMHESGLAKIDAAQLPPDLITQLGGFDPKAMDEFRKAQKREAEIAQQIRSQVRMEEARDRTVWEPLPTLIESARAKAGEPAFKERLERYRHILDRIQLHCRPLLSKGAATPSQVSSWCSAVVHGEVEEGMPLELVLLSKGDPSRYGRRNGRVSYLAYDDSPRSLMIFIDEDSGRVSSWTD